MVLLLQPLPLSIDRFRLIVAVVAAAEGRDAEKVNAFGVGFVENAGYCVAIGVDDVGGVGREKALYSKVLVGGGRLWRRRWRYERLWPAFWWWR